MLTEDEKVKIRSHMGFLNTSVGAALALGVPSASPILFILESAMNSILPQAEALTRRCIVELDCIEDQLSQARTRFSTSKVDAITFDAHEEYRLEDQYSRWQRKLADIFGTPLNPFSRHNQRLNGEVFVVEPT